MIGKDWLSRFDAVRREIDRFPQASQALRQKFSALLDEGPEHYEVAPTVADRRPDATLRDLEAAHAPPVDPEVDPCPSSRPAQLAAAGYPLRRVDDGPGGVEWFGRGRYKSA